METCDFTFFLWIYEEFEMKLAYRQQNTAKLIIRKVCKCLKIQIWVAFKPRVSRGTFELAKQFLSKVQKTQNAASKCYFRSINLTNKKIN